jgi:2-iminobutanoate/2-iminopropanoate deaminase
MPLAIRELYDELKKTLAVRGLDFRNVVKENVFTTDLDAFKASKEIRFVVEVELVAVFPKG